MIKILKFGEVSKDDIFARTEPAVNVEAIVSEIIENVKQNGDKALYEYNEKFDKAKLDCLLVSEEEIKEAVALVEPKFLEILKSAAENIREYHKNQVRSGFEIKKADGVIIGQKVIPVDKAGLYVPGGTAAYPSTVLMDSIPAKIAGCKEVVMVTPPSQNGKINPVILAQKGEQTGWEGCLSVVGKSGIVSRPMKVKLSYQDRNGEKHLLQAKGFFARAICHELDHLDGILYIDKATHIERN